MVKQKKKRTCITQSGKNYTINCAIQGMRLKCHYDENHIFSIEAILKHKQVACMRWKLLFTIFKYLFLFQRYSSF